MKFILFITMFGIFFYQTKAQTHLKKFNDCSSARNYEVYKSDTVLIHCDSVIILTKQKFRIYQANNRSYPEIVRIYDNYVNVLEQRIEQQNIEYNKLKILNDSLVLVSGSYIDSIDLKAGDLKTGLTQTLTNLETIKTDVSSLKDDIQKACKLGKLKSKLLWGGGGVLIGVIFGSLLN